jgi:hypothetical protein
MIHALMLLVAVPVLCVPIALFWAWVQASGR